MDMIALKVIGDHWPDIAGWIDDSTWLVCSCGWDSSAPKAVDWVTHLENAIKEAAMDQLIVTLDGTDHYIGQGEHTVCYLPVPIGSTREEKAKQCKVCFGIVDEPAVWPAEEPAPEPEPAKKATKAK